MKRKFLSLERITMCVALLAMMSGLLVSLSSFDEADDANKPKWRKDQGTHPCKDVTATISPSINNDGTVGLSVNAGPLGNFGLTLNQPGSVNTGGGSFTYTITFPKDAAGNPPNGSYTFCWTGGSDKCSPSDDCITNAVGIIRNGVR